MTLVVISRTLTLELGTANAQELANDFRDYKSGVVSFGARFGRDRAFRWPTEARAESLWHVHLEDDDAVETWDYLSANYHKRGFTQDNYTSNTILVYGHLFDVRRSPYLLHAILKPNGHDMMDDEPFMRSLAAEFKEVRREYADYAINPVPPHWVTSM